MNISRLDAALGYAADQLPVLPCHWPTDRGCSCRWQDCASPGKHPLTPHGKDDASTDPALIRRWWSLWPAANVAVRPPPGVIVLDVDPRHGGATALADLTRQHGPLPETWTARTGGAGLHIWFRYGGPRPGRLRAGLDIKGDTGYLLVAPSHHASGGTYQWINDVPTASAPGWLRRLLDPPRRPVTLPAVEPDGRAGDGLVRMVRSAAAGNRNRALHWAACRAHERAADPDLLTALVDAAVTAGLSELEARRTVASAARTSGAQT